MKTIKNWNQFNENKIDEALSNLQKEYREFFRAMLDCYEVTSPSKLSEEKKKEFFDNIKKYWVKGKGCTKSLDKIKDEVCNIKHNEQKIGDYAIGTKLNNEYTKILNGPKGGKLDLGKVGQFPEASLYNIKQTYKDAVIKIVDDHYILMRK